MSAAITSAISAAGEIDRHYPTVVSYFAAAAVPAPAMQI